MRMKKWILLTLILSMVFCCIGCGRKEKVKLVLWTPSEDISVMEQSVEEFKDYYSDKADIHVEIYEEDVSGAKKIMLTTPEEAADVFRIADDQIYDLVSADVLMPITEGLDNIILRSGGDTEPVVQAAFRDGYMYGCPATASNGYFLYYNTDFFTEEDVKSLDRILEICDQQGKNFAMDWSSGWYLYSFFGGAGKHVYANEAGTQNICNFNSITGIYTGKDVAQAMLQIAEHPSFQNIENGAMIDAVNDSEVIAFVSGPWHEGELRKLWQDKLGACKLPTYSLKGSQVQMHSFAGFTYYAVNKNTKEPVWAQRLAEWVTNYDTQILRYEKVGDCPSILEAATVGQVQASTVMAAFREQSKYSVAQNVLEPYWDPMSALGMCLAMKNPDHIDLQELLDTTVDEITR